MMEESLRELLKCVVCLEQVEQLKVLPCQHTICLSCVKQLTVREGRFKCPTCNKEHTIPNGGFDQLPESLVSKQIADILKREHKAKHAAAGSESSEKVEKPKSLTGKVTSLLTSKGGFGFVPGKEETGTSGGSGSTSLRGAADVRPKESSAKTSKAGNKKEGKTSTNTEKERVPKREDVAKLKLALEAAYEKAEELAQSAFIKINVETKLQQEKEEQAETARGRIKEYRKKTIKLCQDKLDDIDQAFRSKEVDIREYLKPVQSFADQMNSATNSASSNLQRLLGSNVSCLRADGLVEVQNSALLLKELNHEVRRQEFDLTNTTGLQPGDAVRLKQKINYWDNMDEFLKEKVPHKSTGVIFAIETEDIPPSSPLFGVLLKKPTFVVQFPDGQTWRSTKMLPEKVLTKRRLPFVGDKVKVKSTVKKDDLKNLLVAYSSDPPSKDSVGLLIENRLTIGLPSMFTGGNYDVTVNFFNEGRWYGKYTDIEVADGCPFIPCQKVRINRSISRPSRGWGGISRSSVGSVLAVSREGEDELVRVKFPECKNWVGAASDLEPVLDLKKGEKVQMKLSVDCRTKYKGRLTHEDVGEFHYTDTDHPYKSVALVKFPKTFEFYCDNDDIEPVRYVAPSYDKGFEASIEGNQITMENAVDLSSPPHFLELLSSA